jgi:hypothetical protein
MLVKKGTYIAFGLTITKLQALKAGATLPSPSTRLALAVEAVVPHQRWLAVIAQMQPPKKTPPRRSARRAGANVAPTACASGAASTWAQAAGRLDMGLPGLGFSGLGWSTAR